MPYTNNWSDSIPLGSLPANQIDSAIQQLRLDIHERMNNVVADWTADPVVPLNADGTPSFGVVYDDTESNGSKASGYVDIVCHLNIRYTGQAVNNQVVINLNEINTLTGDDWQVANLFLPTVDSGINLPAAFVGRLSGDKGLVLRRLVPDTGANTITLIMTAVDGMGITPQTVDISLTLPFTVLPSTPS